MRSPTKSEVDILDKLLVKANISTLAVSLKVETMRDSGMGSLRIGNQLEGRVFGGTVSELNIKDSDGVEVLASLNVDQNGELFELDIFKVDWSPTKILRSDT